MLMGVARFSIFERYAFSACEKSTNIRSIVNHKRTRKEFHNMSKKSVFCITANRGQAEQIVDQLRHEGFSQNDISALFPDKETSRDFAHEKNTKAPEGAAAGAGTGGVLGGALGWLAGVGALAIPGVGPLIAAGPILAALSGVAVGAAVGGVAGALIGMGIPEYEAKRYEGKIKEGNILISVHVEGSDEAVRVMEIFEAADARDIATSGESSVPDREDPRATPYSERTESVRHAS